ncbi:hypothetical protein ACIQUO_05280 [Streptomyces albogriseolus]|uniref:Prokaryotic metallothionein n=2 Tax=Streptomyces albogriseolus group TaxID=2867120 RepID=A0ABP6TIS7_9ACTN|nr:MULTISPECIES: hypothetical protein [Streptomyces]GHB85061.1 hypothetical protein GCM10010332_05960 [Streptomyces albogriseolus]MCX4570768.1 hypothetical protein [Streptomyces viridodiastaticus]NIL54404.1 hypothetical protein [Streptomyces sp. 2BBP-J2]WPP33408.1 hypothetical protein SJH97_30575 [Streptomyces sp. CL7]GHG01018.1 hypothetical protein GCM10018777_09430 [Streptomyces viridodiastaticus]
MAVCEVCGNDYALSFEVHMVDGSAHTFDSIECAAHKLAPICDNCGCKVLGHGHQVGGQFFCCAHCARAQGHAELADSA